MGGGGDVVGALGITDLLDGLGTEWVLGGVAWERSPIDPRPGPRSLEEIRGGRPCGSAAVLTEGRRRRPSTASSSRNRRWPPISAKPVLLLDITRGPQALATGLAEAAEELDCDAVVLLDVGGDVLAHGDEAGLASPLCDAIVLAAGLFLSRSHEVIGAVYGPGCDGELTPDEVLERITALQSAEALLGAWGLTPRACELVESAAAGRADRGEPDGRPLRPRRAGRGPDPRRQAKRRAHPARAPHLLLRPGGGREVGRPARHRGLPRRPASRRHTRR